jgi:hypothetical protein
MTPAIHLAEIAVPEHPKEAPVQQQQEDIAMPQPHIEVIAMSQQFQQHGPRCSTHLSKQSGGLYISVLEKALKKKEGATRSNTGKRPKKAGASSSQNNTSVPPPLLVEQLIQIGRECGYDDRE